MADKTFTAGTVIDSAWLNDVNRLTYDLPSTASGKGSTLLAYSATAHLAPSTVGGALGARNISITDYPFSCISGTDCTTAIIAADALLSAAGGGVLLFPAGVWKYSGNLTRSVNVTWRGTGFGSKLSCINSTAQIFHTGARGGLEHLYIEGPHSTQALRIAAPATSIGVVDNGAQTWVTNVRVQFFKTGWSKTIGYWCDYYKLWLEQNGIGWSYDNTAGNFSNLLNFFGCTFRQNDRNGIASTAATNNTSINYFGCDVEANCSESPTVYPQIQITNSRNVNWYGGYCEPGGVFPAPDLWNFQNMSVVQVTGMYLGGARKAFFSGANGSSNIDIKSIYFAGGPSVITSAAYDFPSCANVKVVDYTAHTATITLDGAGSQIIGASQLIATRSAPASYTPALSGSGTAGAFTYTNQTGRSSQIGNQLTVAGRISTSAITLAPTGNLQISLPAASVNVSNVRYTCALDCTGITLTGGNTYLYGRLEPGSNQLTLFQGGVTSTPLVAGNLGAAATIHWSITYEVAPL